LSLVLVIEDNEDNLRILTYALERAGYAVISAGRGDAGAALALRERPDFILMDINMPGMDGIEATRRIRDTEGGGRIPIIAITSYAMTGDRERIIDAGCDGYIEKPIDPLTIVESIRSMLRREGRIGWADTSSKYS
jgi:two-component system, cell cycle response regulator DivK